MTLKIAIGAKAHKNAISKDFLSTLRLSPFLGQKINHCEKKWEKIGNPDQVKGGYLCLSWLVLAVGNSQPSCVLVGPNMGLKILF